MVQLATPEKERRASSIVAVDLVGFEARRELKSDCFQPTSDGLQPKDNKSTFSRIYSLCCSLASAGLR